MHKNYLTDEEFFRIYTRVPRLNVDLVIESEGKILLAKRNIEPNHGEWHLLGGTVYKEETITEASVRIAKAESGLDVKVLRCLGYMEFLHEMRSGVVNKNIKGELHTISIVMEAQSIGGSVKKDDNADELQFFEETPENNVVKEHYAFLKGLESKRDSIKTLLG